MKSKFITVIVCIVLLGGLLGVNYYMKNKPQPEEPEVPKEDPIMLIDRSVDDITRVTFTSEKGSMSVIPKMVKDSTGYESRKWFLEAHQDITVNSSTIGSMITPLYYLSPELVTENISNPEEYGLKPAKATAVAEYSDGSTHTVYIGMATPAKDYYYVSVEGNNNLYMMYSTTGDRFFYTEDDLIDKSLPQINVEALQYAYINDNGTELEMDYKGSDDEKKKDLEAYGMISLTMMKPYKGRDLYLSNFIDNVLSNLSGVSLGKLVDVQPTDLAQYGLDKPSLELKFKDTELTFHLLIGKEDEDGQQAYCKLSDKPSVFLIDKAKLSAFYNINPFKFIDRFVSLINIDDIYKMDITKNNEKTEIYLNHEALPLEEGEEEPEMIIKPTINGQEVQDLAFRTFYQAVIGLSYDSEIEEYKPTVEPEVTIKFYGVEGKPDIVTRYYPYNGDFYAVQRDDFPIQFVVSNHSVRLMFKSIDDLLAGKLDRDH